MNNIITLDTLRIKAPSIFTQTSAEHTSDKYQHISTISVVESLMTEGFLPTWVAQSNARSVEKKVYTKHMIRFRHRDVTPSLSQLFPELVLVNSHDGLSSYRLNAGLFRLVCSNGLIAGHSYEEVRVRHQGDVIGNVIEGTYKVLDNTKLMLESAQQMSAIKLTSMEKQFFAEAAHEIRFEDSSMGEIITADKLLKPRRHVDANANDLFTVFNIVQENVIKGGLLGYTRDRYYRSLRSRTVNSIDQNLKLNKALWTMAEKMLQLKQ